MTQPTNNNNKPKLQLKESLCNLWVFLTVVAQVSSAFVLYFTVKRHVTTDAVAVVLLIDAAYNVTKVFMVVK